MGDGKSIGWGGQIDYGHSNNCHLGSTCMRIAYTPVSPTVYWVGISWQHPKGNWAAINEGFNLDEATRLTFWARGKEGGEAVTFSVGGLGRDAETCVPDAPYPDSVCPPVSTSPLLSTTWQQYSIDLVGKDLAHVIMGFLVSIGGGEAQTIYLDEIRYESGSQVTMTATATPTPTSTPTCTATTSPTPCVSVISTPIPMALIAQECEASIFEGNGGSLSFPENGCDVGQKPDAIKLQWDVSRSESYAGCEINLPPEFASVAQDNTHLVLWVQGEQGGEQFIIGLASSDGTEEKETVPPVPVVGHQICIPLKEFVEGEVDLAQLNKLIIAFEYYLSEGSRRSSICIGEIGFGSP